MGVDGKRKRNIRFETVIFEEIKLSFGREIKCPECGATNLEYVKSYVYKCLECSSVFNVLENPESLELFGEVSTSSQTSTTGSEDNPPNTFPLMPSNC